MLLHEMFLTVNLIQENSVMEHLSYIGKSHALSVCLYLDNLTIVSQVTCMIKA